MSRAPAALSAGISVLTPRLGTTVSSAFMPVLASGSTVGEDIAGSIAVTALANTGMHAVETVVPKRGVNTLIPALKAAGARDILEIPISKIVE